MDLVPGNTYYIKYIIQTSGFENPQARGNIRQPYTRPKMLAIFVFECKFIKFVDQTIKNDVIRYREMENGPDDEDDDENEATSFDNEFRAIQERHPYLNAFTNGQHNLPFDDARYPYTPQSRYEFSLKRDRDLKLGLFKYIRLVHTTINDQIYNKKFRETLCKNRFADNLYELDNYDAPFVRGYSGTSFAQNRASHEEFIPNESLLWVALDQPNFIKIIQGNAQETMLIEKTLTNLENKTGFNPVPWIHKSKAKPLPRLPTDIIREIAEFADSKEYLNKTRSKGGKLKRRKNKTKTRKM